MLSVTRKKLLSFSVADMEIGCHKLTHLVRPCLQFAVRLSSVLNTLSVFSACITDSLDKSDLYEAEMLWSSAGVRTGFSWGLIL